MPNYNIFFIDLFVQYYDYLTDKKNISLGYWHILYTKLCTCNYFDKENWRFLFFVMPCAKKYNDPDKLDMCVFLTNAKSLIISV